MTPETETVPYSELHPVVPYFPFSVHKLLLSLPKQPYLRHYSNSQTTLVSNAKEPKIALFL